MCLVSECISVIKRKWLKGVWSWSPIRMQNAAQITPEGRFCIMGTVASAHVLVTRAAHGDLHRLPSMDEGAPFSHVTYLSLGSRYSRTQPGISGNEQSAARTPCLRAINEENSLLPSNKPERYHSHPSGFRRNFLSAMSPSTERHVLFKLPQR